MAIRFRWICGTKRIGKGRRVDRIVREEMIGGVGGGRIGVRCNSILLQPPAFEIKKGRNQ